MKLEQFKNDVTSHLSKMTAINRVKMLIQFLLSAIALIVPVKHGKNVVDYTKKTADRKIELVINGVSYYLSNLLTNNNPKLGKNIYEFKLLAGYTCSQLCHGCYSVKGYRYTARYYRALLVTALTVLQPTYFFELITNQIKRQNIKFVRIHTDGDFYSKAYFKIWEKIARACPKTKFYAYSKETWARTNLANFNIVNSWITLRDGSRVANFAKIDNLKKYMQQSVSVRFLCPCNKKNAMTGLCSKCMHCVTCDNAVFEEH